jgi:hypothetical protein
MINLKVSKTPKSKKLQKSEFHCEYCKVYLTSETRLLNHVCEPKRRVLQRSERQVTLGFHTYQRFWKSKMNPKYAPDWVHFEKSGLYSSFVKFGRHVINLNAINPLGFVDFLLRGEVGIDQWCKDTYYQAYVRELTKLETPLEALQRNMVLMEEWANHNKEHWTDFFRKVAPTQAVLWIMSGRISPWVLLTAPSASILLNKLNEEQTKLVESVIDMRFWEIKMERHALEVQSIVSELNENNL